MSIGFGNEDQVSGASGDRHLVTQGSVVQGLRASQKPSALQVCSVVPCSSLEFRVWGSEHEAAFTTGLRWEVKWCFILALGEYRWSFEGQVVSVYIYIYTYISLWGP